MANFKIPPIVTESYAELYDLCQNHNRNGVLNPKDVAAFLGKDFDWFRSCIYAGAVPFAFGTNKMVERGTSCIHVLPFYQFATQGIMFRPVADREYVGEISGLVL